MIIIRWHTFRGEDFSCSNCSYEFDFLTPSITETNLDTHLVYYALSGLWINFMPNSRKVAFTQEEDHIFILRANTIKHSARDDDRVIIVMSSHHHGWQLDTKPVRDVDLSRRRSSQAADLSHLQLGVSQGNGLVKVTQGDLQITWLDLKMYMFHQLCNFSNLQNDVKGWNVLPRVFLTSRRQTRIWDRSWLPFVSTLWHRQCLFLLARPRCLCEQTR